MISKDVVVWYDPFLRWNTYLENNPPWSLLKCQLHSDLFDDFNLPYRRRPNGNCHSLLQIINSVSFQYHLLKISTSLATHITEKGTRFQISTQYQSRVDNNFFGRGCIISCHVRSCFTHNVGHNDTHWVASIKVLHETQLDFLSIPNQILFYNVTCIEERSGCCGHDG